MVVQSAKAASEFFKNHDLTFCDRRVPHAVTSWGYDKGSLAFGRYGEDWRLLRRLCTTELRRVNETADARRKCVDNMIRWIENDADRSRAQGGSGSVEICRFLFLMAFNVVGNVVVSKDVLEPESDEGREFFDAMNGIMEWAGKPNVSDFFPFLKRFDPMRIKKNMDRDMGRAVKIVNEFVNQRVQRNRRSGTEKINRDLLDVMLECQGHGKGESGEVYSRNVTIIILEMFFAGSDTISSTLEWAMTELLHDPKTMTNIKEELDKVVGSKRKVEESDIDGLPYLRAVVKETLRLHPAIPLLPRNSMHDSDYMGYSIPENTQVFVNAWAIGRDPECWDDPLSFKPERFLDKNIEYQGQHFELVPFGSGRRVCAGLSLAHRVLHLALAAMLQTFDWELDDEANPGYINMNERMGFTLRKLVPLKAIPKNRITV